MELLLEDRLRERFLRALFLLFLLFLRLRDRDMLLELLLLTELLVLLLEDELFDVLRLAELFLLMPIAPNMARESSTHSLILRALASASRTISSCARVAATPFALLAASWHGGHNVSRAWA